MSREWWNDFRIYGHGVRPSDRVRSALARISRDRWLSPKEAEHIVCRLSRCCSGNTRVTERSVMTKGMHATGVLRGHAIAEPCDPWFHDVERRARHLKRKHAHDLTPEITLLLLMTKRGRYAI